MQFVAQRNAEEMQDVTSNFRSENELEFYAKPL